MNTLDKNEYLNEVSKLLKVVSDEKHIMFDYPPFVESASMDREEQEKEKLHFNKLYRRKLLKFLQKKMLNMHWFMAYSMMKQVTAVRLKSSIATYKQKIEKNISIYRQIYGRNVPTFGCAMMVMTKRYFIMPLVVRIFIFL